MMKGGAVVNSLAFSGSNFGFSLLNKSKALEETKRHNAAMEKLQQARDCCNKERMERIDYINESLKKNDILLLNSKMFTRLCNSILLLMERS